MYDIKPYTKKKAEEYGVVIFPSDNPKKKLDVYDKQSYLFICRVGDSAYKDYPTYMLEKGKEYAEKRRRLYHIRHKTDEQRRGSPGWFASKLLW